MASRGQALRKLSLLNSNQKKTSAETDEPFVGVKENYLSKCKRYLKSLPSNTVIVDTPAARGSKTVSKKKLNFVAKNATEAGDDVMENEDPKKVPDAEVEEDTEAGPSQGLCLLWRTGQLESPSKASDADEETDKRGKSPESEAPVNDDDGDEVNVETAESSDGQPSPRKEPAAAVEKSVDENIAEELSANILNDSEPMAGNDEIESDENVPVPKKGLKNKRKSKKERASKTIDKAEKTKRAVEQSVKSGFLTLKKNLRTLQVKNGLEADFLLIMKNNYQKKQKKNSSVTAEKYITFAAGDLKEMFSSGSGVVYNPEKFVILDNSENMDVDQQETIKAIQNIGKTPEVLKSPKKKNKKKSSVPPPPPVSESESDSEEQSEDSSEALDSSKSSDSDISSNLDIFNMGAQAVRVDTPGTSRDSLRDSGTLVYGSGAKKTTEEVQKQREKRKKETAEASKKVQSDVLGAVGGKPKAKVVRKGGGKKGGKTGGKKGGKKGTQSKSMRL